MSTKDQLIADLGPVMQLAFVPQDFDATLQFWIKVMGAGPFFMMEHIKLQDLKYRGQPSEIDFTVALTYWGDTQIELIKQHNDAPSIYKDSFDTGREDLNHVCILVGDMPHAREVCAKVGAVVLQEGKLSNGGEVIYVGTGGGPIVEIVYLPPGGDAGFNYIREQARNWDGSDPIRSRAQAPRS